jgi:hypothetical protein
MAPCRVRAAVHHDPVSMRRRRRRSMPAGGVRRDSVLSRRESQRPARVLCAAAGERAGDCASRGGPAARRGQLSAGLSPRKLTAGGGRFGLGRPGLAAMMRRCRRDSHHVCCLLIRDGRWACLAGPRARRQVAQHRRPDSGPGAQPGKASGLNAASLAVSRRGDQVLSAAKAGSCISGGACGGRGATGDHARHRLVALAAGRVRR